MKVIQTEYLGVFSRMYAFDLFVHHVLTCVFHVSSGMYWRVCFMLVRKYIWNILEVCVSAGTSNTLIFKYILPEVCGILELCVSAGSILEYTCIYDRLFVWVSVFVPCIWLIFGVWRLCIICPRWKRVKHALHVIYITRVFLDLIWHLYWGVFLRICEFDSFLHHVCGSYECPQL